MDRCSHVSILFSHTHTHLNLCLYILIYVYNLNMRTGVLSCMQCLQRPQEGLRAPGIEVKVEVSCSWVLRIGLLEEQSLFSNPEPALQSLSIDIFKAVCDCFFHSASKEHTPGALDLKISSSARRCL